LIPRHIHDLGVTVIPKLEDGLEWADVANMLRVQHERMDRAYFPSIREYHMRYGVTMEKLKKLSSIPLILHPGPINRGVEITSEVADSEYAIILDQVQNGVAVRMAVLYLLASQGKNIA
jgi:aspartate carbamoyltransferase catalytic subunit